MRHVVAFTIRDSDRDELYWEELALQKGADSWGMYLGDGLADNDIAEIYLRFPAREPAAEIAAAVRKSGCLGAVSADCLGLWRAA